MNPLGKEPTMSAFYVVSTCANHYRLANDGKFYCGSVEHGRKPNNVKEFKRLGWAKRAAEKAVNESPWIDAVVIKVEDGEYMMRDGLIFSRDENLDWVDRGYGRIVAEVVKSNFQTALFG
jgi:hypothetical protein